MNIKILSTLLIAFLFISSLGAQKARVKVFEDEDGVTMEIKQKKEVVKSQIIEAQIEVIQYDTVSTSVFDSTGTENITLAIDTILIQESESLKKVANELKRRWIAEDVRTVKKLKPLVDAAEARLEALRAYDYELIKSNAAPEPVAVNEVLKQILKDRNYTDADDLSAFFGRSSDVKRVASELGLSTSGSRDDAAKRIFDFINL